MCADGIDPMQVDAMRRAFAELRAAAQRVLEQADATALDALRAACAADPEAFIVAAKPMHRMVLRLPTAR